MPHQGVRRGHNKSGKTLAKQINTWLAMKMCSDILKEVNLLESRFIKSRSSHI